MRFKSEFPQNKWDWDSMSHADIVAWATYDSVSYKLSERWKLQNNFIDILDLGSGAGRNTRVLAHYGFRVRGLDIDERAIRHARDFDRKPYNISQFQPTNISYDLGDMTNMPYPDMSFDAVFAENIVYLTSYEGMCRTISEIHRVLRPKGEVFVKLMKSDAKYFKNKTRISRNTFSCPVQYGTAQSVACGVTCDDLPQIFKGFKILDSDGTLHGYTPDSHEFLILARKIKSK